MAREETAGFQKRFVFVGESVEVPVHHDAVDDLGGILTDERFRSALHKISEQVSDAGGVGGTGEIEMGEIVHGLPGILAEFTRVANPQIGRAHD